MIGLTTALIGEQWLTYSTKCKNEPNGGCRGAQIPILYKIQYQIMFDSFTVCKILKTRNGGTDGVAHDQLCEGKCSKTGERNRELNKVY